MKGLGISKILGSVALIAFTGAVAVSATGAFFNDTETSTGNTFTAGAIDLKVDAQAHYDGLICSETSPSVFQWIDDAADATPTTRPELLNQPCDGTWAMTDLGLTHKFFNLADVKPGDDGENTVSLHVDNNAAYACVDINVTANDDMSSTDPELAAPDVAEDANNFFDGELAQNLDFFAWLDQGSIPAFQCTTSGACPADPTEGDNVWQGETAEPHLFSNVHGPLSDAIPNGKHYTLASPQTQALPAGSSSFIGLAWCAGTFTVGPTSYSCSGVSMGNVAQTDKAVADITFRVEQARNNPNFTCTLQQP